MFVFAADLHLSNITWNRLPEVNQDSLLSFEQLLSLSSKNHCPLVLGGDVFDSIKMTPELLTQTLTIRNRYLDVPLYYINGNHDAISPSWCSFFENAYHLGSQPLNIGDGQTICGIDFQLSEAFPEAVKEVYPFCDYLVIHQTLDKLSNSLPGSLDSTPLEHFRCVLAGDYHLARSVDNLHSPGSTNRRTIAEESGNALLVRDTQTIENLPLVCRPMVVVSSDTDYEDALAALQAQKNMVDFSEFPDLAKGIIVVRGSTNGDLKSKWENAISDRAFLLFVPKSESTTDIYLEGTQGTIVRGSRAFILETLQKFPCSDSVKKLIADYLTAPDTLLSSLRSQLTK